MVSNFAKRRLAAIFVELSDNDPEAFAYLFNTMGDCMEPVLTNEGTLRTWKFCFTDKLSENGQRVLSEICTPPKGETS